MQAAKQSINGTFWRDREAWLAWEAQQAAGPLLSEDRRVDAGGGGAQARGLHREIAAAVKALAFDQHGGLDRLRYRDVPDPVIGAGDVLVRVRAVALNHLDLGGTVRHRVG